MTRFCTVADSGWRAGGPPTEVAFSAKGQVLATELRRWHSGEQREQTGPEEVGAVLEGHFELRCGDERHELAAGQGILIPAGEPHVWQILSDTGVLYRVTGPAS